MSLKFKSSSHRVLPSNETTSRLVKEQTMKSKEANQKITTSLMLENLSDLLEELSDEAAADCVGGVKLTIPTETVSAITNPLVKVNANAEVAGQDIVVDNIPGGTLRFRSDRNQKEHFAPVDVQEVLGKVATLPITTWNYKDRKAEIRHIGPMAQDFAAAFGVGEDNRSINVVDANGVALAAIQALYQQLQEQTAEIRTLRTELDALKQQMIDTKMHSSIDTPQAALNCN